MSFVEHLEQRARAEQATVVRNPDTGAEVETWTVMKSNIPVLASQIRNPADVPLGLQDQVDHLVLMEPWNSLLSGRWSLFVSTPGQAGEQEMRVITVRDPAKRGHHYEVLCRRLS